MGVGRSVTVRAKPRFGQDLVPGSVSRNTSRGTCEAPQPGSIPTYPYSTRVAGQAIATEAKPVLNARLAMDASCRSLLLPIVPRYKVIPLFEDYVSRGPKGDSRRDVSRWPPSQDRLLGYCVVRPWWLDSPAVLRIPQNSTQRMPLLFTQRCEEST